MPFSIFAGTTQEICFGWLRPSFSTESFIVFSLFSVFTKYRPISSFSPAMAIFVPFMSRKPFFVSFSQSGSAPCHLAL